MIAATHPFQQRSLNALDENGNEGCASCGRPRDVHPVPVSAAALASLGELAYGRWLASAAERGLLPDGAPAWADLSGDEQGALEDQAQAAAQAVRDEIRAARAAGGDCIACEVPAGLATVAPVGYQGPAQHTYTAACDGFHEPGQCPRTDPPRTVRFGIDDDPWAEANAAGAL